MPQIQSFQGLPTKSICELYHVGDIDCSSHQDTFSYEGRGLSVSKHPDAWRRIASGVGGKTYKLTYGGDSNIFYKADTENPRDQILDWCVENGYTRRVNGWKASVYDFETSEWRYTLHYSYNDAVQCSEANIKQDAYIESVDVLRLGEKGKKYWNDAFSKEPNSATPIEIKGLTPIWFAESHDADGVWWSYELKPNLLTAPKGVIFQDKLSGWTVTEEID